VLLDLATGKIFVEDIPVPHVGSKNVLVQTHYSAVSLGTELRTIRFARASLIKKAMERPDLVKQVLEVAKKSGVLEALTKVRERISMPFPLGYSVAGEVIAVGRDVKDFKVGDRVACVGAEYAYHAEVVSVPENMCVKVPSNVDLQEAAFVALGAIAIHGVRNGDISFGETVAVIGLGVLGLITVQILKAAGCIVVGVDVDERKVKLARELGIDYAFNLKSLGSRVSDEILNITNGIGADAVIITAATKSNEPVNLAGKIARDRAKVVIVGDVGTRFNRETYYRKELRLVVSRSYGPGRYDPIYEEKGVDYPIGYVRWTLRRNMEEFIRLLSEKKINMKKIITHVFSVEEAPKAYEMILSGSSNTPIIGVVFKYRSPEEKQLEYSNTVYVSKGVERGADGKLKSEKIRIGVIGAGAHAIGVMLPVLKKLKNHIEFVGIASASGISSTAIAKKYGFKYSTTDYRQILEDPDVDTVLILTRNSLHAKLTVEALNHGKHVFVEKPLALSVEELGSVIDAWRRSDRVLMVGFNRRYSPFTEEIVKVFKNRTMPALALYRVNAEKLDPAHWVYSPSEGGGRIVSELPHFIDYLVYVLGEKPRYISCKTIESGDTKLALDNFTVTILFEKGSIGTIVYTSQGYRFFSKEYLEIHSGGITAVLRDFKYLNIKGEGLSITRRELLRAEKGHFEEVKRFISAIRGEVNIENETKLALISTLVSLLAIKSARDNGKLLEINYFIKNFDL